VFDVRVVVHDYSGHPGQAQLSRALAARGHEVTHQYCASYQTGRGAVDRAPGDPDGYTAEALSLGSSFARYSPWLRIKQEIQYGGIAARAIRRADPDVALLSNIPLISLLITSSLLRRARIPFVFWQQDVYSAAIGSAAVARLGRKGRPIGLVAERIERRIARTSAAVVPIDDTFTGPLHGWGVPDSRVHVIPNWAPIVELPVRSKDNAWSRRNGIAGSRVVLYSGTLGLKHDPSLLVEAADSLRGVATVVVVSQGLGRSVLEQARSERGLDNLLLLDFQPYQDLPDVMASADVLVALLEPDASKYSVPSKVLSYLCAARPIVAVIPEANSVARIISSADAGVVVRPGDHAGLTAALTGLLDDEADRTLMGKGARRYAEETFDVTAVAARFEQILEQASR
jgi:glycosyltransferase involved in cell wall biosynthesis